MIFATLLTAAVLLTIAAGCYGCYRLECRAAGEKPVKFFGW